MGVATGCGCKEVYIYISQYYLTLLLLYIFFSSIPNVFRSCSSTFCNYIYFFTQYKHTYGQLRVSHGSHMKAAHTVLYMKKHTQT